MVSDHSFHGLRLVENQRRVDNRQLAPSWPEHTRRTRHGFHGVCQAPISVVTELAVSQVDLLLTGAIGFVRNIAHDAYNGEVFASGSEHLAERIVVSVHGSRERLADYGNRFSVLVVEACKRPTGQERNAQRFEIVTLYNPDHRCVPLALTGVIEVSVTPFVVVPIGGQPRRRSYVAHSGKRREPVVKLVVKRHSLFGIFVSHRRQVYFKRGHIGSTEAEVDVLQRHEALHENSCTNQQHDRQ
jgi:hypothetical protein